MLTERPAPAELERYLRVLGVLRRPPGVHALRELTAAHLCRVPFENLSKLLYRLDPGMRLPPLERFLDGIESNHLGGTCYSNNYHMGLLLRHLGYESRLCGADMSHPDVHVANVVTLDGREYLVDVGYGAPFFAPMPLDSEEDVVVTLGGDRYVLKPRGPDGSSVVQLHRDGKLRHGYRLKPEAREIEEFAGVIESSYSEKATFMNALMMVRFRPGASVSLYNLALLECEGADRRTTELQGPDLLPATIHEKFGANPELVRTALTGISLTRNVFD